MGPRWEEAFRQYLRRLAEAGDLGDGIVAIGPFRIAEGSLEIDAVALAGRGRQAVLLGEAKWSQELDGREALRDLERKAGALPRVVDDPSPFTVESVDGSAFTEFDLRGTRTILLFLGARCAACERLVDDLESGRAPRVGARLVAVSESADEASRLARSARITVVIDEQRSAARAFESQIVPHAFVVDDGIVGASGRPNDWDGLKDLLTRAGKGGDHQPDVAAEAVTPR